MLSSHGQSCGPTWSRRTVCSRLMHWTSMASCRMERLGKLQPGVAAKIYGIANFFELGVWGRIGCGGLAPIKRRQQERSAELTEELRQMLQPVAHHYYYQTLQANRNPATCRGCVFWQPLMPHWKAQARVQEDFW